ncbi:MAG: UDP-N-acetylmuramoyl-L-alanyl-D-glutamate--2,6-diaminopimelate ligase [Rickettsiaceae bacterium]
MKHKINALILKFRIKGISCNSHEIKPNSAFFAIKGEKFDGNAFIDEAFAKGALIVFTDNPLMAQSDKIIFLANIRLGLALAAEILYSTIPKNLIAVTGTNGKSSVVSYIHQILSLLGKTSACIGTLGLETNMSIDDLSMQQNSGLTTGDPVTLRKYLNTLEQHGVENVALEASSHGLAQYRLGEIKFKSAAFISFSQDHLDYHGSMEKYLDAKLSLFTNNLSSKGEAVISSDIEKLDLIENFFITNNISYFTVGKTGNMAIINNCHNIGGQEISFLFLNQEYKFITDIIGSFQAVNLLIAAKLVYNLGINFDSIVKVLPKLRPVCGRLQRVTELTSDCQVFVDYAHTPDALEKSLTELRLLKPGNSKLYVVFGCGGDRDASKRPVMGKIAASIADHVIITDDNPRTEDADKIRQEIFVCAPNAKIVGDRYKAIVDTINSLNKGDILLIAGKGHENYQIIGTQTNEFSDIAVAKFASKNKM